MHPNPILQSERIADKPIDLLFLQRWSPIHFKPDPLTQDQIDTLFEAARWAPSCYNDQPWHFVYGTNGPEREAMNNLLLPKNREWASKAPMLVFVVARKHFAYNGAPNAWCEFDSGAAWMALALQAKLLGLAAHSMAGFDEERAYTVLDIDKSKFRVCSAVAIGYWNPDAPPSLPGSTKEAITTRRARTAFVFRGHMGQMD